MEWYSPTMYTRLLPLHRAIGDVTRTMPSFITWASSSFPEESFPVVVFVNTTPWESG